jgi:hypothetical protein
MAIVVLNSQIITPSSPAIPTSTSGFEDVFSTPMQATHFKVQFNEDDDISQLED